MARLGERTSRPIPIPWTQRRLPANKEAYPDHKQHLPHGRSSEQVHRGTPHCPLGCGAPIETMAHIQCIYPALKQNRMAVHNHMWKALTDIFRTLLPPPDFTIVMEASSSAIEAALNAIAGDKYQQQRDEVTRCLSHIQNADWEDPHPLPPASPTNPHNWNPSVHEPPLLLVTGRPTQRQRTTDSFEPPGEHQPTLLRHPDTTQTRAPEPRRPTTAYSKQRPDSLLLDWRNRKRYMTRISTKETNTNRSASKYSDTYLVPGLALSPPSP